MCAECKLELAHVEMTPSGRVREVLGWLRKPGDVLNDRYRVRGVLGKGGYAATYLVEDLRLNNKRRALKEIPNSLYDEYETGLLSRLTHPAIPDISDRFEADAMNYLVLEFGGDRTLEAERRAAGGKIAVDKVIAWMRQLMDVLSYLHGQTPPIVHRDLKPENILLDERGRIMLIDFGIAKESGDFAATRTLARSASHGFSPPEQVLGTGTDQRSDVYALGATMYALLAGQVPPPAHERVAGRELIAPSALNPAVPAALEGAILQALDLNINERPQSIADLAAALDGARSGAKTADTDSQFSQRTVPLSRTTPISKPAPAAVPAAVAGRPIRPEIAWGAAILLLILVAAASWLALRPAPSQPEPAVAVEKPPSSTDEQTTASNAPPAPQVPPAGVAETAPASLPAPAVQPAAVQPAAVQPPAPQDQPAVASGGSSALSALSEHRRPDADSEVPEKPVKKKAAAARDTAPAKKRADQSRVAAPGKPSWVIKPGEATRVD
jgi:serine/threonine-protein kinase